MNIYDIAREAGVSPSTVSRVLNGFKNVKEETRTKVLAVIEGENYVPNILARNLSVGQSRNIAFLVPDIENPFFGKILHGISDQAAACDYNVFMFGTDESVEREHKVLDSLKAEMMKGMIVIPVSQNDRETVARLNKFEKEGIPVVLVDRDIRGGEFDGVFSEDVSGVMEAMECLFVEGHRKIAIITGPDLSKPGHDRLKGYKKALEKRKIPVRQDYIICGDFREEESYQAMKTLMEMPDPPTAVFASNNLTILGCLRCMKEKKLTLCEDISIVGFDDIKELEYTNIHLTVVTRPVYEMGREAMGLLERRFQNRTVPGEEKLVVQRSTVKTWLIKRGSEQYRRFQEGKDHE